MNHSVSLFFISFHCNNSLSFGCWIIQYQWRKKNEIKWWIYTRKKNISTILFSKISKPTTELKYKKKKENHTAAATVEKCIILMRELEWIHSINQFHSKTFFFFLQNEWFHFILFFLFAKIWLTSCHVSVCFAVLHIKCKLHLVNDDSFIFFYKRIYFKKITKQKLCILKKINFIVIFYPINLIIIIIIISNEKHCRHC